MGSLISICPVCRASVPLDDAAYHSCTSNAPKVAKSQSAKYNEQIDTLVDYINLKIKQRDWHAVSDAANDIRELQSKIDLLKELNRD